MWSVQSIFSSTLTDVGNSRLCTGPSIALGALGDLIFLSEKCFFSHSVMRCLNKQVLVM